MKSALAAVGSRGIRFVSMGLICSLLLPPCLAQPSPALSDWRRVRNLPSHTLLAIQTKTGKWYRGELMSVAPDSIRFDSGERGFPGRIKRPRELARNEVHQVRRLSPGASAWAGAGIGAAVGLGSDRQPIQQHGPADNVSLYFRFFS